MNYIFSVVFLLFISAQDFNWLSFDMTKRTVSNGKSSTSVARVYYKSDGNMVTKFLNPLDLYVLNDKLGYVQIYNPRTNEVVKSLDNRFGSRNNTFYSFLFSSDDDLGLSQSGFELVNSRVEDMMLISEFSPPGDFQMNVKRVELVSDGEKPVFMGYVDKDDRYTRKIYYYDYDWVMNVQFPKTITEIVYMGSDSTITKTTFGDFRIDVESDQEVVEFQVPQNAILTE
ncbi:MAG: hypothetical protein JXR10_00710 [Cyclobacteriaceae bacterium]